jgi:glycosyltransferase involved in cell wall biosynthesis
MKRATITIIIPVYNVENFVNETLLSVRNQISQPDEVIVINDGSTDGSSNIINNYKDLKGWKIINRSNHGLGLTRNFGKSIAISEYIYFLDSDDIIKKDLIFHMRLVIEKNNKPDMILFSGEAFANKESINKKINLKFTLNGKYDSGSVVIRELLNRKEALPQVSRYITKVELWSKNKLNYPNCTYEDEAVFFPLLALSKNIILITEVYFKYRIDRFDSVTNRKPDTKHALGYLHIINFIIEFMKKNPELVKLDLSAWRYKLGRNGLKYISMCMITSTNISLKMIVILFLNVKSVKYPFKLLWRVLKFLSSNSPKNDLRN